MVLNDGAEIYETLGSHASWNVPETAFYNSFPSYIKLQTIVLSRADIRRFMTSLQIELGKLKTT